MALELECPICEADIPLERDDQQGDLIMCSYCKVTYKLLKNKEKWILSEEYEEQNEDPLFLRPPELCI